MNNDTIGVDVVERPSRRPPSWPTAPPRRFANDGKGGHKALIKMARGDAFIPGRVRTDRALSSRRRTRAGHQLAFRSSRSIPVRRAASLRRPASWRSVRNRLDAAILALGMGAMLELEARPARKRALVRTGRSFTSLARTLVKDRTAAKNLRKSSTTALAAEASECSAPRTDRSPDRDSRSRNPPDCRSRRKPRRSLSPS